MADRMFVEFRFPGGPSAYLDTFYSARVNVMNDAVFFLGGFLADGLLVRILLPSRLYVCLFVGVSYTARGWCGVTTIMLLPSPLSSGSERSVRCALKCDEHPLTRVPLVVSMKDSWEIAQPGATLEQAMPAAFTTAYIAGTVSGK
jgi:hypothetical protein